jgi:hypothetical protein
MKFANDSPGEFVNEGAPLEPCAGIAARPDCLCDIMAVLDLRGGMGTEVLGGGMGNVTVGKGAGGIMGIVTKGMGGGIESVRNDLGKGVVWGGGVALPVCVGEGGSDKGRGMLTACRVIDVAVLRGSGDVGRDGIRDSASLVGEGKLLKEVV